MFVRWPTCSGRYRVDAERISVTGLSMGGTGSSELALRYPDYFAAAAPMGAAYSFPWLAANGEHLPFWCIGGEHDRNFQLGGRLVADRMERLNFPTRLDIRAGRGHADFVPEYYDGVIAWLVRQRVRRHPTGYSFSAALPLHGLRTGPPLTPSKGRGPSVPSMPRLSASIGSVWLPTT